MNRIKIVSCLFLLLFLQAKDLYSQDLIVDDSVKLKRGVYMSFEEFKYNSPSVLYPDFLVEVKERKIKKPDGKRYEQYRLIFDTPVPFNEDSIWGFCDGKDAYVKGEDEFFGKNNYDKIIYLGRYCCFYRWQEGSPVAPPSGGNIPDKLYYKIININNGANSYIDKKTMKLILSKDDGLLKEFKADKIRSKRYFYYLINYSELHKDEIKR